MPTLPSTLIRPTIATPPEPESEPVEADGAEQGASPEPARTRARGRVRRDRATEATKGRKLHLPDSVFDRLQLLAIQRKTTVSAVASDILDRNLPRLRIERDA